MALTKKSRKKLVLLDTHAIIHRAYHALPEFSNSKGEPTGALYGLATMVFKIITELNPDYIVACYDLPKKTFRHEAYDNYKAGRAKTDDALVNQIIKSRDLFNALSIPYYECEGFEADDLLGTISEQVKKEDNIDVVIASGDMDTLQLVDGDRVCVYTLKKGINDTILYNEKGVGERFNFPPKLLPDYKGLRGDPSDNIIGIKGIGEKTATILISQIGTIEDIYKTIDKDESKLIGLGLTERTIKLLKEGHDEAVFSKTLATIRKDAPIKFVLPENVWKSMVKPEQVVLFFREMEFKSLLTRFNNILGENTNSGISSKEITKNKIINNTTIDSEKNQKAKIAFWLLNSEKTNPDIEEVSLYKGSRSIDEAISKMEEDIKKENLTYVYKEIELPLIPVINEMEKTGINIDKNYLKELGVEYRKELKSYENKIWQYAQGEFNINSPKQLGEVLFDRLGLSVKGMKKSKGGARSTRESELDKLKDLHPIINEILNYRELQKLLSTYIDTMDQYISQDGRLHPRFVQTGTTTGRFSSIDPNVQNIPIKTDKGKNIRKCFIAENGYKIVSFDYSQIELRIAALLSQDEFFIKSFKNGNDIHESVAMRVFNVSKDKVTPDMRRRAKIINFGILYGMGVNALRANLGTDRKEAQEFYDNYFSEFPTIANYLESIKNFAKKHGYTETLFGRKRYFPGIKSPIPYIRAMSERMATNAPIQGTATADLIKISMYKVREELIKNSLLDKARLVLQVHDELVYEIKEEFVDKAVQIILNTMKNAIPKEFLENLDKVPLEVSYNIGDNWGEAK